MDGFDKDYKFQTFPHQVSHGQVLRESKVLWTGVYNELINISYSLGEGKDYKKIKLQLSYYAMKVLN